MIKLSKIKVNPNNPRLIKDDKFKKLVNSIREFPKMMALRPMGVNNDWVVLGGNMRLKALSELGYKEIPDEWVKQASELTEDEARRFIIADNVGFGEHDWDMLANEWNTEDLEEWGVDLPLGFDEYKETKDIPDIGEIEFSNELLLEHNYIVLYFDNAMDWEVAQSKFGLKIVKSKESSEKCQKIGVGRVINGRDYL